jgi:hypothetical protein
MWRRGGELRPTKQLMARRGGKRRTIPQRRSDFARMREAVEQRDAAVGALGLKMPHATPIVINVRPAADPDCSTDYWR